MHILVKAQKTFGIQIGLFRISLTNRNYFTFKLNIYIEMGIQFNFKYNNGKFKHTYC